jgi:hydrogenase nickel incorporation protein HypA/HybF
MHELSLAMSLLEVATEEAARQWASRVAAIHVKLGPLAGVVKEALTLAFKLAREGSALPDVELLVQEVPVSAYCPCCEAERGVVSVQELCCVECASPVTKVLRGRELEVVALEIGK